MTSQNDHLQIEGSPLSEDHFRAITEAETMAEEARKQIDLAKQAGIDVGDREDRLAEQVKSLRSIKQVYFPGR